MFQTIWILAYQEIDGVPNYKARPNHQVGILFALSFDHGATLLFPCIKLNFIGANIELIHIVQLFKSQFSCITSLKIKNFQAHSPLCSTSTGKWYLWM